MLGRKIDASLISEIKAKARAFEIRTLDKASPASSDFRPDRVNVLIDDRQTVLSITCG